MGKYFLLFEASRTISPVYTGEVTYSYTLIPSVVCLLGHFIDSWAYKTPMWGLQLTCCKESSGQFCVRLATYGTN